MKNFFAVFFAIALSSAVHAETDLACWNMFAARGAKPIFTAKISDETTLMNAQWNLKDAWFEAYIGENSNSGFRATSKIVQPPRKLEPKEITTNHSPYKGNNEYTFVAGTYARSDEPGKYIARLILPTDLSSEFLKTFRIRDQNERSNAVVVIPPSVLTDQGGDNYLRMFCTSK